jgi:transcriptional regulator with GAF, ATPase, and Fis domain/serine/threonine protein kinase
MVYNKNVTGDGSMKFAEDIIGKASILEVLKDSPQAFTTLVKAIDGKQYIVKKFRPEYAAEARTEYLFLQTAKGDNIINAVDLISAESPTLVLEYIPGETLSAGSFHSWKEFEICFAELSQNLALIHSCGICLNDIKPQNLIVNEGTAFLIDFGLATINLYFDRNFRGTPAFAAPEKILRQTNHLASDVFSLGMTMFYCKHGKTIMEITGQEEYNKIIGREDLWQRQLEIQETDSLIRSLLCHAPAKRPIAIEVAKVLAKKHKLKLKAWEKGFIENYVFRAQTAVAERLWKKKTLACEYQDEPQIIENLLSLWSETDGEKLLILDENLFVSQPEEFFRSFPFGYREKNVYQSHFVEWLQEQPLRILLRRYRQLSQTNFFDEIQKRTTAMQLWLGLDSDLKTVGPREIQDILAVLPATKEAKDRIKRQVNSARPFHARLMLLSLFQQVKTTGIVNELVDFLAWLKIPLPLVIVEKVWENWFSLVQDGVLNRMIFFDSNSVRYEAKHSSPEVPAAALLERMLEYSAGTGIYNIAGEIHFLTGKRNEALENWSRYVDELIKKEYFLSGYEFVVQLRTRIKDLSFDLRKKEAFLARICGHFELSNQLYEKLIQESDGLLKAVLAVDRAIVLQALKRYDEAIVSYKDAIELFRVHKDLKSLLRAMNNLGVVYFGLQKFTDAEQLFNDVLEEARQHGNVQFEAISYLNLSDIQLKRCEWKRVLYYTDKAITLTYINQKWNLHANSMVIKSRALFALGDFPEAIKLLTDLKDDPKARENLLQYQEIIAWLIHFYDICEPDQADAIVAECDLNIATMHEILRREMFFFYLGRKRFLQAGLYLRELEEMTVMQAFFDSDVGLIAQKIKDVKALSELDSYLYYLSHFVRLFTHAALANFQDEISEAQNLYTYKPINPLLQKDSYLANPSKFWTEFMDAGSQASDERELIHLILSYWQRLQKADKFIYMKYANDRPVPLEALDASGNRCSMENLTLSQQLLDLASRNDGFFYLHPASQYMQADTNSSVLGLGIEIVSGFSVRISAKLVGIFYCDSTQDLLVDEETQAACRILFLIGNSALVQFHRQHQPENYQELEEDVEDDAAAHSIIGKSKAMREIHAKIALVAGHNVNVLITGPTGSGKELVAKEIHRQYIMKNRSQLKTPFVAVNCAAIPEQLLESELFGYMKGAFTGAVSDKKGKLHLADKGTIFLDEIGEMPLLLQSKMLRVIQEKVVTPLGSDQDIPVDVRIIAASNQSLEAMVEQNKFRADLFYRLKVMTIDVPPLSERVDDIPLLAKAMLKKFNAKLQKNIAGFHPSLMSYLQNREWKGNVRELENEIERAVLLCNKEHLSLDDFNADSEASAGSIFRNLPLKWQQFKDYKKRIETELEKRYIRLLMDEAGQNVMKASKIGELDRMQIYRLMKTDESE